MDNTKTLPSREDKLQALDLDITLTKRKLDDKILDTLYNKFIIEKQKEEQEKQKNKEQDNEKLKSGIYIKKPKNPKIDKNSEKYKVTLEFLNAILKILGNNEINDITDFKDIRRDDLLKPECKKILDDYLEKIIEQFGKKKLCYSMRYNIETYILTIIRNIVTLCGYNFISGKKIKNVIIENNKYGHVYILTYSIG